MNSHKNYLVHVDGLRAVAVMAVVLFHINHAFCPGGFSGVDIFFVISGYLVIGGIYRDLIEDRFSLGKFYERRIRRIFPAFAVFTALVLIVGGWVYYAEKLKTLGATALYGCVSLTNIYFFRNQSYFAQNSEENALLNLWSLAVEEQFYIIIPLIGIYLFKSNRKYFLPVMIGLGIASLVVSQYYVSVHSSAAFYLIHSRAWELIAGGVLALMPLPKKTANASVYATAGLILIGAPFFLLDQSSSFPGLGAMPSVLGACLIIRYGAAAKVCHFLRFTPVVWVGLISYSLYLFHWPIIVYWKYIRYDEWVAWDYLIVLFLSFFLGWLSWRYVETPVRVGQFWKKWKVYAGFLVGNVILMILAFKGAYKNKLATVLRPEIVLNEPKPYWRGIPYSADHENKGVTILGKSNFDNIKATPLILLGVPTEKASYCLWGDSHAMAISGGFDRLSKKNNIAGVYIERRHSLLSGVNKCSTTGSDKIYSEENESALAWIEGQPSIKTIFLSSRWAQSCEGTNGDGREAVAYLALADSNKSEHLSQRELFEKGLRETCVRLRAMGKNVVILESIPEFRHSVYDYSCREKLVPWFASGNKLTLDDFSARQIHVLKIWKDFKENNLANFIAIEKALRNGECYRDSINGVLLYNDSNHLSMSGAEYVTETLGSELISWMKAGR